MLRVILLLVINSYCVMSWASNELRELEYAEEIEASFSTGEIVWLRAKNKKFLGLYTETEKMENMGTVIIVHPRNGNPNQTELINPLRTYLPKHNWATLSLQMPVLSVEAAEKEYYSLFDDASARIQAGVDYLVSAGVKNIVLVGYELGGLMAVNYMSSNQSKELAAIVTISMGVPKTDHKKAQVIEFIKNIKQPFLDIYAEYDLTDVTTSARKRRIAGKSSSAYRQFQVEGEGHLFQHDEGLVVKRIYSWINWTFK